MADVTLSYKGSDILELSDSGSATLKTGGKYCEDDIAVEYVKPSGGGVLEFSDLKIEVFSGYSDDRNIVANYTGTGQIVNGNVISCRKSVPFKKITINVPNGGYSYLDFRHEENSLSMLEEIEINGLVFTSIYQGFQEVHGGSYTSLKSIHTLDLSRCGGGNYKLGNGFSNQTKLETLLIKPNTMGVLDLSSHSGNTMNVSSCSLLTDESLVSIANGCNATNTSSISFHGTPKARLSTIMGTVSQVTDDTGTYDFFTADANGTVTLIDFITNTKGWTVA